MAREPLGNPVARTVIGAILAGGRSSRMGTDKAELVVPAKLGPSTHLPAGVAPAAGTTLLQWTSAKLRGAGLSCIVVCGEPHGVADLIPHQGPLSALHSLCQRHPGAQVLAVPIDMPGLSDSVLHALINAGADEQRPLHYEGFQLPLLLSLTPAVGRVLEHILITAGADRSLAGFLRRTEAQSLVAPVDPAEFTNVNTPEEWQAFLASFQRAD